MKELTWNRKGKFKYRENTFSNYNFKKNSAAMHLWLEKIIRNQRSNMYFRDCDEIRNHNFKMNDELWSQLTKISMW